MADLWILILQALVCWHGYETPTTRISSLALGVKVANLQHDACVIPGLYASMDSSNLQK